MSGFRTRLDRAKIRTLAGGGSTSGVEAKPESGEPTAAETAESFPLRVRARKVDPLRYFVAPRWSLMAPTLGVLSLLSALFKLSLPDPVAATCILGAVGLCLGAPRWSMLEHRIGPDGWLRYPLMLTAIALPMMLFGYGSARWTVGSVPPQWDVAVSAGVIVILVSNSLLEGRLTAITAAIIALWGGAAYYGGSPRSSGLVALAGAIGLALAIRHARDTSALVLDRARRERQKRRAEQFLGDYEETGQGWFWETDRLGRITYVTDRIAKLIGKAMDELVGRPFTSLFLLEAKDQESERTLTFHLNTRSSFQELQVRAAT